MIGRPGDVLTLRAGGEPFRFLVVGPLSDDQKRRAREVERIQQYRAVRARLATKRKASE